MIFEHTIHLSFKPQHQFPQNLVSEAPSCSSVAHPVRSLKPAEILLEESHNINKQNIVNRPLPLSLKFNVNVNICSWSHF